MHVHMVHIYPTLTELVYLTVYHVLLGIIAQSVHLCLFHVLRVLMVIRCNCHYAKLVPLEVFA